jgi:hypothetical protein
MDPKGTIELEGGMEKSESGLLVPRGLGLKREAWTSQDMKAARRFGRWAASMHLKPILYCDQCEMPVTITVNTIYGTVESMECQCKRRVPIDD